MLNVLLYNLIIKQKQQLMLGKMIHKRELDIVPVKLKWSIDGRETTYSRLKADCSPVHCENSILTVADTYGHT